MLPSWTPRAPGGPSSFRIDWVDSVKGLGILLVFYGHFLQVAKGNAAANSQLRLIYSFHMPLFFVLSGFFFRAPRNLALRIRQLAARRLVPVAFFSFLLAPLWAWSEVRHKLPIFHDTILLGEEYLLGRPALDWVTWFLVCLFVCEVLALVALPAIKGPLERIVFGFACIWGGVFLCAHSVAPSAGLIFFVSRTWFLSEAVVALGFYAIGAALYPELHHLEGRRWLAGLLVIGGAALVLATFRLNHPAAVAVMMAAREHGNVFDFTVTALAGTLAVIALGTQLGRVPYLAEVGKNSLSLLGLNGLFFHHVDPLLTRLLHMPNSPGIVTIEALIVTLLSLLVCAPVVVVLNRYVPQLIGRSQVQGPWLPSLEGAPARVVPSLPSRPEVTPRRDVPK